MKSLTKIFYFHAIDTLFSVSELVNNAKDFETAKITTPVRSGLLWKRLRSYKHRATISRGFRDGFRIGVDRPILSRHESSKKFISSHNLEQLTSKLNVELEQRRILGPYDSLPTDSLVISPLYVIPKSTPGKFRLIHDLSYPKGNSVNDHINDERKSVVYCSLLEVAEVILKSPEQLYMAKVDLRDAYRIVPIHKDDWKYLGMRYKDKYLVDTTLPMGLGTSCKIFQMISDSLAWIFRQDHIDCYMFNYLDDFLILGRSKHQCDDALTSFLTTLKDLGFPVSMEKTVVSTQSIEFLGIGIDSLNHCFFIPDDKRAKAVSFIDQFLVRKKAKVHEIQKLVGKLTFLSQVFIPGRALLRGLHEQLTGILSQEGWHSRRISRSVKEDLRVWRGFLVDESSAKPFRFLFPGEVPAAVITTDAASSIGYGGYNGSQWFKGRWNDGWWMDQNITLLELYPIYVAVNIWLNELSNKTVLIRTDNDAVVATISKLYSRENYVNKLLKSMALTLMKNNVVLKCEHIPGVKNVIADMLSRDAGNLSHNQVVKIPASLSTVETKNMLRG